MFKKITLIGALVFFSYGFSQISRKQQLDTIVKKNGSKTELIITNSTSKTKRIVRLKNEKLDGFQEEFGRNDVLFKKSEYKDGFLNGIVFSYDYQGNLTEEKPYKFKPNRNNSVIEGELKLYRNKKLYAVTTYKDSLKEGTFKEFYPDGVLMNSGNYKKNLLFGKNERFHNNKALNVVSNYEIIDDNGKLKSVLNGAYKEFSNSGKLYTDGFYDLGKKEGLWKNYNRRSEFLESETNYKNDKIHGINNRYNQEGNLISKSIFYAEIEKDGVLLKNVFDGNRQEFSAKGVLTLNESYIFGKRNGLYERFSENGILLESGNYKNNLKVGLWQNFDTKGVKNQEINYKILIVNEQESSVKDGFETQWNNGVLVYKIYYENGIENGVIESYYPNGKPESYGRKKDGMLDGDYFKYYENGNLKTKQTFVAEKPTNGDGYKTKGWRYEYDENGSLIAQYFNLDRGDQPITILYRNGQITRYEIPKLLSIFSFPSSDLMSLKVANNNNQAIFGIYFYQNNNFRKLIYQDPAALKENQVVFSDNGNYQHEYSDYYAYISKDGLLNFSNSDTDNSVALKVNEQVKIAYLEAINPSWAKSKLVTDVVKNGNYKLEYKNNKPFLEINFEDNLPHGKMIVFEPIKGDTLLYRNYNHGFLSGVEIEKFAGKTTVKKRKYYENGKLEHDFLSFKDGKPYHKYYYNEEGKQIKTVTYHNNGLLENERNDVNNTFNRFDNNGFLLEEKKKLSNDENWSVLKRYHPNSKILKSESYYFNELQDSIYSQFYEDGKLQYKSRYKGGKRNGFYLEYDKVGDIKSLGQYKEDVVDGNWTRYENAIAKNYFYINGKLQIVPSNKKCECIDTLYSSNKIRYAPMLDNLLTFNKLKKNLPAFIKPIDNFNFNAVFYINYQFSNGNNGGFSSLKLLLFKPFSFYLPSDQQLKLTLNPCKTEGYISTIDLTANYSFDDVTQTRATLVPQRISFELVNSPLKSNDKDYVNFTAFYDVDRLNFGYEDQFSIDYKKETNACYALAKIKDFLFIEVVKAKPLFFERPETNLLYNQTIKSSELDNFFGFDIQEAKVVFEFKEQDKTIKINSKTDQLLASGKFASGRINIPCKKVSEDTFETTNETEKQLFSSQNLKKEWMKKGCSRLLINYNQEQLQLEVYFFAE